MRPAPRLISGVVSLLVVLVFLGFQSWKKPSSLPGISAPRTVPASTSVDTSVNAALRAAARAHESGAEVAASGRVTRLLPDDTTGARHQRFLVHIADGLTILVAHNRDLAPRIPVQPGDSVILRGEYVWNERGGMIHWTHHDPTHRHEPGWIEYHGRRYD